MGGWRITEAQQIIWKSTQVIEMIKIIMHALSFWCDIYWGFKESYKPETKTLVLQSQTLNVYVHMAILRPHAQTAVFKFQSKFICTIP